MEVTFCHSMSQLLFTGEPWSINKWDEEHAKVDFSESGFTSVVVTSKILLLCLGSSKLDWEGLEEHQNWFGCCSCVCVCVRVCVCARVGDRGD